MTSVQDQNPEEQATPAATGEAHVSVTQIETPDGFTTSVTITGTAEQVRTAQRIMNPPPPMPAQMRDEVSA